MKNLKLGVSLFVLVLLTLTSCGGTTAPIIERDNAIKEIELAEQINAPEYAFDDYTKAGDSFDLGQELIDEKEKTEENTKAKQHYIDAYNAAKMAFDKSAEAYLGDYIKETDRIIQDIEAQNSDEDAINEAKAKNEEASTELSESRFRESLVLAIEARELSDTLRGVESVEEESVEEEAVAGEEIKYTVQEKDTLWSIAKEELGNGFRWIEIYKANIDQIENFNLIFPNQVFTFDPNNDEIIEQFSFVESNDEDTYVVNYKPNGRQSLWSIAEQQLGDAQLWEQIYDLNKNIIEDPHLIYPGQKLKLKN